MANTDFHIGDVVRLKCAGPNMVVHEIRQDGSVVCEYIDERDVFHTHFCSAATLEKIEKPRPARKKNRGKGFDVLAQ